MKSALYIALFLGCVFVSNIRANELEDAFKALAEKSEQPNETKSQKMAEGLSGVLVGGKDMIGKSIVLECYSIGIPALDKVMLSSTYPGVTNFVIASYEEAPKADKVKLLSSEGKILQVRGEVDKADPEKREMGEYVVRITNIALSGEELKNAPERLQPSNSEKVTSQSSPETSNQNAQDAALTESNKQTLQLAPIDVTDVPN